ncbi:glucoamylase family protein [Pontibaca methylaminivorans]|uniref:Glycoamylase-like domain-containing protein n=1 Tax=Pontibaca methylaminivorans TaxID=515897 RepID=A0A1R3X727_9RHOB|nr:glucoamylase family protein [Pontibaca methylaminivorans]SIT86558.1 hypothetical protein SAMN05421849_2322 [Pontibaca methylaminivorans]
MNSLSCLVEKVQRDAFHFFPAHANPLNGLVHDSTQPFTPSSIAAVGFALTCYPVAVRRGWMSHDVALGHCLAAVRFFDEADLSGGAEASGYRGFFYHFLDMTTGRRAWESELSTIDTALLIAGILFTARFFTGDSEAEAELRRRADAIYGRVEWDWAQNGGGAISLGWTPEGGFLPWRWIGYSEALILYALALGAPDHPASTESYDEWLSGYRWKKVYDIEYLYAGPLFIHQFSHIWIDFRGIFDRYMAERGIDYFENSRRATIIHREYAIRNPRGWESYSGDCWGLTASNGPGPARHLLSNGEERDFYGYRARGAPFGPDDGTVSPWASIASLPFAPEIVESAIDCLAHRAQCQHSTFGFYGSLNPSFHLEPGDSGWVCEWHVALNQGPVVLMVENHRDGFVWDLMRGCAPVVRGLAKAGFRGGWLG